MCQLQGLFTIKQVDSIFIYGTAEDWEDIVSWHLPGASEWTLKNFKQNSWWSKPVPSKYKYSVLSVYQYEWSPAL